MTKQDLSELHEALVQLVADFIQDKELPSNSWTLCFTIDDLQTLQKEGKWVPANDSYLGISDVNNEEILWEM